jgi:hypothetical protein
MRPLPLRPATVRSADCKSPSSFNALASCDPPITMLALMAKGLSLLIFFLLSPLSIFAAGQVLITGTNTVASLEIPEGEIAIVSLARSNLRSSPTSTILADYTSPEQTNEVAIEIRKETLIAGPAKLFIRTNTPSIFVFTRLKVSQFHTVAIGGSKLADINIKEGEEFQLFPLLYYSGAVTPFSVVADISTPTAEILGVRMFGGEKIPGPAAIKIRANTTTVLTLFSYGVIPEISTFELIQQNSGLSTDRKFTIEKSTDLRNWSPILLQILRAGDEGFYRVRIDR